MHLNVNYDFYTGKVSCPSMPPQRIHMSSFSGIPRNVLGKVKHKYAHIHLDKGKHLLYVVLYHVFSSGSRGQSPPPPTLNSFLCRIPDERLPVFPHPHPPFCVWTLECLRTQSLQLHSSLPTLSLWRAWPISRLWISSPPLTCITIPKLLTGNSLHITWGSFLKMQAQVRGFLCFWESHGFSSLREVKAMPHALLSPLASPPIILPVSTPATLAPQSS